MDCATMVVIRRRLPKRIDSILCSSSLKKGTANGPKTRSQSKSQPMASRFSIVQVIHRLPAPALRLPVLAMRPHRGVAGVPQVPP